MGGGAAGLASGWHDVLIVAQIAISLLLVIAASLFVRTLSNLHSVELGFNRENLLIFSLNARQAGYEDDAIARFYGSLARRFRGIPGVRNVGFSQFPLVAHFWDDSDVTIPGFPTQPGGKSSAAMVRANESFSRHHADPCSAGSGNRGARHLITPRSRRQPTVCRQIFSGSEYGRHIGIGDRKTDAEIVGVAKTSLYNSLKEDTPPVVYVPYTLDPQELRGVWFELRTAGNPLAAAGEVRKIVHESAPAVPIANLKTQAAQIDQTIAQERTFADLCAWFAVLALVIAGVGLYGTMAYAAARRTSEIGIRMALGSRARRLCG